MKEGRRIKDSFLLGVFAGLFLIPVFYYLVSLIRGLVVDYYGNPYLMHPPIVHLITLMLNVIIFRIVIINLDRERTGKGLLFITVIVTLVYFYIYFRMSKS
jgi:hypothetical protein